MAEQHHSQTVLNSLYEYDSFLDSLVRIVDMGCGTGHDIMWWANLTTRDDPPIPHNYICYAVDKDQSKLNQIPNQSNIIKICADFTDELILSTKVDFVWAHDSLQYSHNPIQTLQRWNQQMNVDAMLAVCVPQHSGVAYNKYYSRSYSGCYYHFTPVNLIYMLAVNGFDCRDAYLLKRHNDPWIHMAVYKSSVAPMDPKTTTWFDLAEKNLLHDSIVRCLNNYGHVKQEEILYPWLDRENYFVDYVSEYTEIPPEAGPPQIIGTPQVFTASELNKIQQATEVTANTALVKPVGILRPKKQSR